MSVGSKISVTPALSIDESEITETFMRSPGPGGQNVNKLETAVHLRFDAAASPSLTRAMFERLRKLAGRRMTQAGVIVINANRHRSRERNRAEARERLVQLIRSASVAPKRRRATKPGRAAKQRRLDRKKRRGQLKKDRARVSE